MIKAKGDSRWIRIGLLRIKVGIYLMKQKIIFTSEILDGIALQLICSLHEAGLDLSSAIETALAGWPKEFLSETIANRTGPQFERLALVQALSEAVESGAIRAVRKTANWALASKQKDLPSDDVKSLAEFMRNVALGISLGCNLGQAVANAMSLSKYESWAKEIRQNSGPSVETLENHQQGLKIFKSLASKFPEMILLEYGLTRLCPVG
jgi:hypothetical protein